MAFDINYADKQTDDEKELFISDCIQVRQEINRIDKSLLPVELIVKIEDIAIMYDQLLERLGNEYGFDVFDNKVELPF